MCACVCVQHYLMAANTAKKRKKKKASSVLTGRKAESDSMCVFHVTTSGVKVHLKLCRVMFGIPQNCV